MICPFCSGTGREGRPHVCEIPFNEESYSLGFREGCLWVEAIYELLDEAYEDEWTFFSDWFKDLKGE